jgi:hypothetical protein
VGRRAITLAALGGTIAALGAIAILSSCAIRYNGAGTTRIGIGLWKFGDPPGVDWNLDWPRREVPDLPAMRPPDLPDRPKPFGADDGRVPEATTRESVSGQPIAIDDNRCRAADCNALAQPTPASVRADPGRGHAARQ